MLRHIVSIFIILFSITPAQARQDVVRLSCHGFIKASGPSKDYESFRPFSEAYVFIEQGRILNDGIHDYVRENNYSGEIWEYDITNYPPRVRAGTPSDKKEALKTLAKKTLSLFVDSLTLSISHGPWPNDKNGYRTLTSMSCVPFENPFKKIRYQDDHTIDHKPIHMKADLTASANRQHIHSATVSGTFHVNR